jgi:iron(III) transport system ATP-binding protein
VLSVDRLVKTFHTGDETVVAVNNIGFSVDASSWVTLLGPSGCGKTTILRSVAGLETPDSGEIVIDDQVVYSSQQRIAHPVHRRPFSMVFQSYAIWPHMTVIGNVLFPLEAQGNWDSKSARRKAMEALEMVGMAAYADRPAPRLSGGQQQRVAVARAIVKDSRLLLLDEPLSNLDAKLRTQMRGELRQLHQELGITALYVTHDQDEALSLSDVVIVMKDGDIVEEGAPDELYLRPKESFTADFLGDAEMWACRSIKTGGPEAIVDTAFGRLVAENYPDGDLDADKAMFMVRPEHIEVYAPDGAPPEGGPALRGAVLSQTFTGSERQYVMGTERGEVRVRDAAVVQWGVGDEVDLVLPPARCAIVRLTP